MLVISGFLGEEGIILIAAQRLAIDEVEPLLIIALTWHVAPVPTTRSHACFDLRSSSQKGVPVGAPASCSVEL